MNSKRKGDVSEAIIIAEMLKRGLNVSVPFGENARYDLIVDNEGNLERVQCKTGYLKDGVIVFNTVSTRSNYSETSEVSYEGQIDKFIVYCPQNEELYEIPIEKASKSEMSLRVVETQNNQKRGINWAKDFRLSK